MSNVTNLEKAAEKLAKKGKRRASASQSMGTYDANGRRIIRHDPGRLPEILDEVGAALAEAGGNLFVYTDRLVRIYSAPESAGSGITRARGTLILHPVDGAHLSELAGRAACHERYDARSEETRHCDCPRRVADAYPTGATLPQRSSRPR